MFRISSSARYYWTQHSRAKMAFYRLSESRIRRVIKSPLRVEEGIAPDTVAFMQPVSYRTKNGIRTWNQELWVMVAARSAASGKSQVESQKQKSGIKSHGLRIISAWRYPGKTKPGAPLPEAIAAEVGEALAAM